MKTFTFIKPAASNIRQARLPWLLCLWACTAATFQAMADPTVIFSTLRLNGRAFSNVVMQVTPVLVTGQSNSILLPFSYSNVTDTAGNMTISNMIPTSYRVTAKYQSGIATWTNCVEAGDGVVYAGYTGALFCGASNSTAFAMNDLRYPSIAGSGITATTNAGRITWSASGGSALTNAAAFQPANTTLTNLGTNYLTGDWTIGTSELTITNSLWTMGTNVTLAELLTGRIYVFGNNPDTGVRSTNAPLTFADLNGNQFTLSVGNFGAVAILTGARLTNMVAVGALTFTNQTQIASVNVATSLVVQAQSLVLSNAGARLGVGTNAAGGGLNVNGNASFNGTITNTASIYSGGALVGAFGNSFNYGQNATVPGSLFIGAATDSGLSRVGAGTNGVMNASSVGGTGSLVMSNSIVLGLIHIRTNTVNTPPTAAQLGMGGIIYWGSNGTPWVSRCLDGSTVESKSIF